MPLTIGFWFLGTVILSAKLLASNKRYFCELNAVFVVEMMDAVLIC